MTNRLRHLLFLFFLVSGFCSLVYQVVWIRLAYASFGVITPVMSVVISVFMLGLSIGSWAGGRWIFRFREKYKCSALLFYAAAELLIGIGAFVVPFLLTSGEQVLLSLGAMNSVKYLLYSAAAIVFSILPWCVLMGFTFPFMMTFAREIDTTDTSSFSFLYFANVVGAMLGTLTSAFVLIELMGFTSTLQIAAGLNFLIAIAAWSIGRRHVYNDFNINGNGSEIKKPSAGAEAPVNRLMLPGTVVCVILFATGFISMSMEVVWIRAFTPILGNLTYSFASLLSVYLAATWIGAYLYRRHLALRKVMSVQQLIGRLALFSMLPFVLNDPRLGAGVFFVFISIAPFSAVLGYLTPYLIDLYSAGGPAGAGRAYALNIIGCIIGPVIASYILLPFFGIKMSFIVLSSPIVIFHTVYFRKTLLTDARAAFTVVLAGFLLIGSWAFNESYEEYMALEEGSEIRRDYTATVVSTGKGFSRQLIVNGIGLTTLTPITKLMAHLPLAFCKNPPESGLAVCFGMGTTYRSLLSWNIRAVAVELVPSVKDAFGYYFEDASEVLNNSDGEIVIDDGRRFLARTSEKFDVITIDPPPPVEAAGSSLLYSEEFYELAKRRLKDNGVLQQWFPAGEEKILQAIARALSNAFPCVKAYKSLGGFGVHFIASTAPLADYDTDVLIARMPPDAQADLLEWFKNKDLEGLISYILANEINMDLLLNPNKDLSITDDQPFNEYYLVRRLIDQNRR